METIYFRQQRLSDKELLLDAVCSIGCLYYERVSKLLQMSELNACERAKGRPLIQVHQSGEKL